MSPKIKLSVYSQIDETTIDERISYFESMVSRFERYGFLTMDGQADLPDGKRQDLYKDRDTFRDGRYAVNSWRVFCNRQRRKRIEVMLWRLALMEYWSMPLDHEDWQQRHHDLKTLANSRGREGDPLDALKTSSPAELLRFEIIDNMWGYIRFGAPDQREKFRKEIAECAEAVAGFYQKPRNREEDSRLENLLGLAKYKIIHIAGLPWDKELAEIRNLVEYDARRVRIESRFVTTEETHAYRMEAMTVLRPKLVGKP